MWAEGACKDILKPHIAGYAYALARGWHTERDYLQLRIARWLKYCTQRLLKPIRMDHTRDPWAILLAKLAGINSPPKARQAFQQYMHKSYETNIEPVVKARWEATCVEADGDSLKAKKKLMPLFAHKLHASFSTSYPQRNKAGYDRGREGRIHQGHEARAV
ncbi:hypothetical protein C8R43DRAFT_963454 [Mycena crocata]|nr:hypothetical protein C8R43DRAFT_963454 [Mycena crocata]